jgi:hypothetical protein
MDGDKYLRLSDQEIASAFSDPHWSERFPPILTIEQVAELLAYPAGTIRDWRSCGLLVNCSRKVGKHVRFFRNRLIQAVFNEGLV